MPNQDKNKPTRKDRLRTVIAGAQKHFPSGSLLLVGQTLTATQLAQLIQLDIDATDAALAAHAAWIEKVQLERASHTKLAPLLRALRSEVFARFGDAKDAASTLGDFGYSPRKVASRPVATKAVAAVKSRATRIARGTMGTVQRKLVKGTVSTAPAAGTVHAPATPQGASGASTTAPATPQGASGTVKP